MDRREISRVWALVFGSLSFLLVCVRLPCAVMGRFAPPPAAALGDGMLQGLGEEEDVRAPLPTKRETLYGDAPMVV